MIKHIIVLIFFSQVAFAQFDTLWTKTYEEELDSLTMYGESLQPTLDGGFVVLGQESAVGQSSVLLMKADSDGEHLWTKTLPHKTYENVDAFSIDETSDSGLVVLTMESNFSCSGTVDSTSKAILVLFRLDANGDTLWTRSYIQDYINYDDLCQYPDFKGLVLRDDNLLFFGCFYLNGEKKTWLMKTDPVGDVIWENTYDMDDALDITEGQEGSLFITGGYGVQGQPATAYIVKIDSNGNLEWTEYETLSLSTRGDKIHSTIDNGFVVCGQYSSDYYIGPWLWKTDSLGNTEWDMGLEGQGINGLGNLVHHPDGTYIIAGYVGMGELSYSLLNMNDSTSNSFTYEGFSPAIDIKSLTADTQITLLQYSGIVKTRYISTHCTADDGTDGVELWSECYSIENTTELDLSYIGVTGEISPEIGNLINLSSLILKENQLGGEIPPEISYLMNLTQLDLGGNQFTGEIPPEIGSLTNLNILDLAGNQLTGTLPPEIGNLANLTELELGGNQVMGAIPLEIGNLESLTFIHLEYNQFTGEIPAEIGNLTNLVWLNFVHNQLTGEIPSSICNMDMNWSDPNNFNISENQLCPPYPDCIEEYVGDQDTTNCVQVSIMDETFPLTHKLHNAYPNPFNPVATLNYDLPENELVNITIYDMMGRVVKTLINDQQTAGYKSIQWNATNNTGQPVSTGLYLYTIEAGKFRQTKKMVLMK